MEKSRIPQIYGYTICLIAVIVGLMSLSSILDAVVDRANPMQADGYGPYTLASFDAYKATSGRDSLSEADHRRRYDALVSERVATTRFRTMKTFLSSGVLLLVAITLFVTHWRWMRRLNSAVT
jgi:hypothetical protein